MKAPRNLAACLVLAAFLPACGSGGDGGGGGGGAPVASAGPDRVVAIDEAATLDGSASSASGPFTYAWAFVSRPPGSTATLSNPSGAAPSFMPDLLGTYVVQLTIDAGGGATDTDSVSVTATPVPAGPRARAGPDVRVGTGARVYIDGLGSSPAWGPVNVTYAWSLLSSPVGSTATLFSTNQISAMFESDLSGTYVVRLSVSDGVTTSQDDVVLTAIPLFAPVETFTAPGATDAVQVGDVTGDGRADLVYVTGSYNTPASDNRLFVAPGNVAGGLDAAVPYVRINVGLIDISLALGDVNGDGRRDVVVGETGGLSVYLQTPGGTLAAAASVPSGYPAAQPRILVIRDFTGDARADVASLTFDVGGNWRVEIFTQDAVGALSPTIVLPYLSGGGDVDLETGDLNGDGLPDLVAMSAQSWAFDNLALFYRLPGGGFSAPAYADLGLDENTRGLGVGDLNGDGRDDAVVSWGGNIPTSRLSVFPQGSAGVLGAPRTGSADQVPDGVEVGDLDGDGRADLVVVVNNHLSVHLQSAHGSFGAWSSFWVGDSGWASQDRLCIGDVNGDGKPDLACTTSSLGPNINLLKNIRP